MGTTIQNTFKNVPLKDILIREGFNTRLDESTSHDSEDIKVLAEDINLNGILTPIQVEPAEDKDKFYLIAGHRRLSAINYANANLGAAIKDVPAIVKRNMDDDTRDAILLSDRLAMQLRPIEFAKAFDRYMKRNNLTQTAAAEKFRVTVAYAGDLKLLANAPEPIQKAVEDGVLSSTEAVRTLKAHGPEDATEIVEELSREASTEPATEQPEATDDSDKPAIQRAKKTRKDTERVANQLGKKPKNPAPKRKKADTETQTDETVERLSLPDLAERVAYDIDNLIAQMQVGNDQGVRNQISKLATWLRSYQQSGYVVKDCMSGITADTTDDDMMWITEAQQKDAA